MKARIPKSILQSAERVLVAVSGGIDSMCLAQLMLEQLPAGRMGVAHFNHRVRGADSDRDAEFVRAWCEQRAVPFFLGERSHSGSASEAELRACRRQFLLSTAETHGFGLICTAIMQMINWRQF